MRLNYFKSKLFLKYIWSYLFILLIPLILMTIFIYESAVSNLRTEIEQSRLGQLTQTKVIIDGRMKELSEIASRVSYDTRLTPYRVHDPIYSGEAIQALDQYKATSSIIDEMFLYFHKDNKIYSSKGLSNIDVFAKSFSFQNWKKETLFRDLDQVKFPTMRPADMVSNSSQLQETKLAYLIPITPNSPTPHGTIMYLIKESELSNLIDSVLGTFQGMTYILDNNGQILVDNRQGEALTNAEAKSLFNNLTPGIHDRTLNGKAHSIVSVKSKNNGWTYVTIMPSSQFFSSVLHVRSFIIMLFVIVVIVGAAIALLLAKMQYQPISMLVEFAASKSNSKRPVDGSIVSGNELDRIWTTLQEYSSRIDLQEPFARNHFLSMLLKYGSAQSLTPELQEAFDLEFDCSHHFVMVIAWDEDIQNERAERQDMIHLLTQIEFPELAAHGYGVELSQLDQLGLIISFNLNNQMDEFSHVRQIVEAVRSNMLETFDIIPMIGVGTCYSSPDQLNQSFIEACSAFELRVSTGHGSVTYFEKLSYTPDHAFWIPNNTLMKLAQSLKQGSYDVAAQMIHSAIQSLRTSELSASLTRCISYDLLNTILKTSSEIGNHNLMQEMAPNLMYSNSLDELERSLLNLASQICDQVEQNNQKEEQSIIDQIVGYINEHYMDHTLSLETVAFEFGISLPMLVVRLRKRWDLISFNIFGKIEWKRLCTN
ncbi:PDC sensor domain-containing protein [Paenibacillus pini]|uniref:Transcriptional regulator n=1 Tax=Paenibacillus pini JCM 16418 TaxID=1236976 RepID=W7Z249_9BACL|nr:AraC family transcriptional regulator [Paenibacillus pini]GAF08489.1 transcriptional regulator [Paenibacillus pini JCM 16418]